MVAPSPAHAPPRNLRWDINMLRAKAGLGSNMAVPRRMAQKAKKRAAGAGRAAVREQLRSLTALQAERRLFHASKQLQASGAGGERSLGRGNEEAEGGGKEGKGEEGRRV